MIVATEAVKNDWYKTVLSGAQDHHAALDPKHHQQGGA
jgi:hypothetical protein